MHVVMSCLSFSHFRKREREHELEQEESAKRQKEFEQKWDVSHVKNTKTSSWSSDYLKMIVGKLPFLFFNYSISLISSSFYTLRFFSLPITGR